jgi:pimeloyl-ACP methyl ester carboxylesterase
MNRIQTKSRAVGTHPPALQIAQLSTGPVQYYEAGTGEALLFVHGLFTNLHLWRKVVPALSAHYRCIVPTLPFGAHSLPVHEDADLSPPALGRLIFELIERLNLRDVTLIGNDTGGALIQLALAERPNDPAIRRVVLTNCDAFDVFPPRRFAYLRVVAHLPIVPDILAFQMRLDFVRRLPIALGSLTKYRIPSEILDLYLRPFVTDRRIRKDTVRILRDIRSHYTQTAAHKLAAVRCPVLLAWAPEDRLFPLRLAEGLAAIFPDSRVVFIADSGTFIMEDQPEELVRIVREFVAASLR